MIRDDEGRRTVGIFRERGPFVVALDVVKRRNSPVKGASCTQITNFSQMGRIVWAFSQKKESSPSLIQSRFAATKKLERSGILPEAGRIEKFLAVFFFLFFFFFNLKLRFLGIFRIFFREASEKGRKQSFHKWWAEVWKNGSNLKFTRLNQCSSVSVDRFFNPYCICISKISNDRVSGARK